MDLELAQVETFDVADWWEWSEKKPLSFWETSTLSDLLSSNVLDDIRNEDCPVGASMMRMCGNPAKPPLFICRFTLDGRTVSALVKGPVKWSCAENMEAIQFAFSNPSSHDTTTGTPCL